MLTGGDDFENGVLATVDFAWHVAFMSLAEIMAEVEVLEASDQKKLAAFLTVLRMKKTGEWEDAEAKLNSGSREGWVSAEEVKRQLAFEP